MDEEKKKKNGEKFLSHIYKTLKKVIDSRPANPVYEYANMLLKKIDMPREEYIDRLKQRKEQKKKDSSSDSHSDKESSSSDSEDDTVGNLMFDFQAQM